MKNRMTRKADKRMRVRDRVSRCRGAMLDAVNNVDPLGADRGVLYGMMTDAGNNAAMTLLTAAPGDKEQIQEAATQVKNAMLSIARKKIREAE